MTSSALNTQNIPDDGGEGQKLTRKPQELSLAPSWGTMMGYFLPSVLPRKSSRGCAAVHTGDREGQGEDHPEASTHHWSHSSPMCAWKPSTMPGVKRRPQCTWCCRGRYSKPLSVELGHPSGDTRAGLQSATIRGSNEGAAGRLAESGQRNLDSAASPGPEGWVMVLFWSLNAVTRKDSYPLPWINDTRDDTTGSAAVSSLDLQNSYWLVKLVPDS